MKQTIFFMTAICGIALLSACGSGAATKKEKTNDRIALGLKGEVKQMKEITKTTGGTTFYTFNEAGDFLEKGVLTPRPFSKMAVTEQYAYDADGKLSSISLLNSHSADLEKKYIYNKEGNVTEEQSYSTDLSGGKKENTLRRTHFYTYNEEGLLIKSQYEDEGNRAEYECDQAGNTLKMTHYSKGVPSRVFRFEYEYDRRGNITKSTRYAPENLNDKKAIMDGQIEYMTESKYDNDDRVVELRTSMYTVAIKEESQVKQKKEYTYQYDEQGNKTEMTCRTCNYSIIDKKGNTEEKCDEPVITTYTYTYDKHGNWTQYESKTDNKTSPGSIRRSFTYYGEETPKLTQETLVGAWDYTTKNGEKYEMVFKKDGTLIDFFDFHTTGTYKVNPEGSILTVVYFYGDSGEESGPVNFEVVEFENDRFVIKIPDGSHTTYERKAKSDNYNEAY